MPIEDWEEVAIGAFTGSVSSETIEQRITGSQDLPVVGALSNSALLNLGIGGVSLAMAGFGARGDGPLAQTESGRNFFAGLGASTIANPLVRRAFGVARAKAVQVRRPTQVKTKKETERKAETPSGEALGGF